MKLLFPLPKHNKVMDWKVFLCIMRNLLFYVKVQDREGFALFKTGRKSLYGIKGRYDSQGNCKPVKPAEFYGSYNMYF